MTSVLIDSMKEGCSGWSGIRNCKKVLISGMEPGDWLTVEFDGPGAETLDVFSDKEIIIPPGATRVRASHIGCGGGRVYVDLI